MLHLIRVPAQAIRAVRERIPAFAGRDRIMHAYRTHTCAALSAANVGEEVRLSGWVHRKRDHGGVLFVDLRDHYGITQIVADSDSPALPVLEQRHAWSRSSRSTAW